MHRSFRIIAFLFFFILLFVQNSYAQTVSITQVDAGPYTPGSSIAVRIAIANGACLDKSNVFTLQLSDANGSFASPVTLGTSNGFNFNGSYASFINGTIPAGAAPGVGYKLRVITSNPATTGAASSAISIIAGAAVTAGTATTPVLATTPETVFGNCIGQASSTFFFQGSSSANALTTSAALINENNGSTEGLVVALPGAMTAINTTNFTVFVKAQAAIGVATKAYLLLNNITRTNFGSSAQGPVCLTTTNGVTSANASFFTDITTASGLQNNYPGMLYTINWGDGTTNTYTFCQLQAATGLFNHTYSTSSCGKTNNAYSISFNATSAFCSNIVSPITTSQAILAPPTNSLTGPANLCTNAAGTFRNTSSPGQSVNGSGATCTDANARYSWLVDGVVKQSGTATGSTFNWTFTTHGPHTIAIHYDNSNSASCTPADKILNVCVQDAPTASFTLSANTVCNPASVTVNNTSTTDNICNSAYTYQYTVTPSTGFTFGGGTSLTSPSPVFNFNAAGKYTVKLQVTPPVGATCPSNIYVDTIYVNGPPVASLSADFSVCGTNKTFRFSNAAGQTQTTLTGTYQTLPTTYNWVVTPPAGGNAATFGPGTSTSQYPTITFTSFGTYTVSVTQTNGCSTSTATQNITFQNAPTIDAVGPSTPICPTASATLTATLSNTTFVTGLPTWTGGTGTFSDPHSLNTSYTPSAADIQAGSVMLTIVQPTTLTGSCSTVSDNVVVNFYPVNNITSPPTQNVCNGSALNYNITSSVSGSTFTWTAVGSANATGFAASGSGSTISEPGIATTTPTANATVTYTITPHANGCDGTPFTLTVTITATPTLTATAASGTICSNVTAGISLSSNINTATMTWTATASSASLTGFTQHTTGTVETQIADVLVNNGTTAATVTYTIIAGNGSCASPPQTVTITVQPKLTTTVTAPTAVCSGQTAGIVLTSNLSAATYIWTATSSSNVVSGYTSNSTPTNNGQIQDVLVNNSTASATVTYVITPSANGCSGTPITKTITVSPVPTATATAASGSICSGTSVAITLGSNLSTAQFSWTVTSGNGSVTGFSQPSAPVTQSQIQDVLVNNGTSATVVTYTITAHNNGCDSQPIVLSITIQPKLTTTGTAPASICSGDISAIVLTSNLSGATYTWTATASNASIIGFTSNASPTTNNQIQDVLTNNGTSLATVTYIITPHANGCDGPALTYTITVAPLPTISAAPATATICSGQPSAITLASNLSTVKYIWTASSSVATISGYSGQSTPLQTAQIQQALVNTGTTAGTVTYTITAVNGATSNNCAGGSATVTVTVQPATVAANAGPDDNVCGVTSYQLKGNDLGPNATGTWTLTSAQTGVTFTNASVYNTTANGLVAGQVYTFRWTSKGAAPCADSFDEVVINDQIANVKAAFTADNTTGCDRLTVNFTNTSTNTTGLTYLWTFGNGVTSTLRTPPAVTYVTQSNGKDSVYTVTLKINNACNSDVTTQTITVKPLKPVVAINPDKTLTCAPFTLNVQNLSPGTNQTYTFFLTDANGNILSKNVKTDKTDQQFPINTPGTYKVYMVGQSECGTAQTATFTVVATLNTAVSRLVVNGTEGTGCAPLTVTFHNNSTGTTGYRYDWGDGTPSLVSTNTNDVTHTFTKGGTYSVVLHASNGCTADVASAPVVINVLYQPTVAFTPDITTGCKSLKVHFTNTTSDPSTSQVGDLIYDWDFGDGSAHSKEVNPTHIYDYKHSPYTVTLTATNQTGCPASLSKTALITVNTSSLTEFVAKPDSVISIPNYRFSFLDLTKGNPVSWKWSFGDGKTATTQNPDHTYADTGLYKVTLTTTNLYCDSTLSHYVRITGVPGQVYLPNAFTPNSTDPDLRTFIIKGSGLKEWHLQIFNNYGQLLWETTKLSEKGVPLESWDGTFQGQPLPQGVYVWQATGTFINGNEWKGMSYNNSAPKHTGVIHLLR